MSQNSNAYLANLLCPGVGHFYLGCKLAGAVFLLIALVLFFAAVYELVMPIAVTIMNLLRDSGHGQIENIRILRVALYFVALIALWIISYFDMFRRRHNSGIESINK